MGVVRGGGGKGPGGRGGGGEGGGKESGGPGCSSTITWLEPTSPRLFALKISSLSPFRINSDKIPSQGLSTWGTLLIHENNVLLGFEVPPQPQLSLPALFQASPIHSLTLFSLRILYCQGNRIPCAASLPPRRGPPRDCSPFRGSLAWVYPGQGGSTTRPTGVKGNCCPLPRAFPPLWKVRALLFLFSELLPQKRIHRPIMH